MYSPRNPIRHRGFTLLEAVFALFVVAGMALVFAAVFPTAQRASKATGYYAEAAALAQHKLEQLRAAGFVPAQSAALLAARGVLDTGSTGAVPYTASFTQVDGLAGGPGAAVFPTGATATVTVQDYAVVNPAVPVGTVDTVTVALQWPTASGTPGTYRLSSLVAQVPHS